MATNGFQGSYANERPPSSTGSGEPDIASDPASSSFFLNDYKKHDDLKQMLDGNKDNMKLEAMKRIIGMVAKGKDASELFPAVVKNVVSKNIEVKKLVYVYLVRYAEEQQDLALLSISTFQRALKDPNQLIRASALRVLSSIRVPMIVPIMMLAIKEAVMDMSPYVRKTAAHAIPKLYSLDPEQKDILIEVIEKLLADKTTLVAGSAIQAFEEVCPERIDLIHKNYRKLCNLLVDVEEWGQVVIINMLTRYARTQFLNPNQEDVLDDESEKAFYEASDDEKDEGSGDKSKKRPYMMDADHRLLLRNCKPLLNSRNAAVVMAVGQLYHHCAPKAEVGIVAKALIRLLRGHREVQYIVLSNIASMSVRRKGMFEPYLKSFYVRSSDSVHSKLLKLEILTNLATETNISTILREFQTYVTSSDKEFAAATIQAIGRCASNISEITDACLNGLVSLLSNRDEAVVGESVVVIKKLLQMQPTEHKDIIIHLAKLADTITVPMARASILWLIGEYSDRVPRIAPDVLRKMAKSFIDEEDIVKLQILNLATKLCITNPRQTKLLCQYVFNLAKYDQNYDIRDRSRFLRQLVIPSGEKPGLLAKHAKKIFLAVKPAPVLNSKFQDRDQLQLGTLSHVINSKALGYQELPDFPESLPDPNVRNVEVSSPWTETYKKKPGEKKKKSFYSESESSSEGSDSTSDDDSDSSSGESSSGSSTEESSSSSEEDSDEESEDSSSGVSDIQPVKPLKKTIPSTHDSNSSSGSEESSDEESSSEDDSSDEESEEEKKPAPPAAKKKQPQKVEKAPTERKKTKPSAPPQKPVDLLLDLDDFTPVSDSTPTITPGSMLSPMSQTPASTTRQPKIQPDYSALSSPSFNPQTTKELLNRVTGRGLGASYYFTRTVSVFSSKMISIEVTFTNSSDSTMEDICITDKRLQSGMQLQEFPKISSLAANTSTSVLMAVDFNDTTQPAQFTIGVDDRKHPVSLTAPVGELVQPYTMTENDFNNLQGRLAGMNENVTTIQMPTENIKSVTISNKVQEVANVLPLACVSPGVYRFSSRTAASGADTLVTVHVTDSKAKITVNCEKMVIGSMLLKDLKIVLLKT